MADYCRATSALGWRYMKRALRMAGLSRLNICIAGNRGSAYAPSRRRRADSKYSRVNALAWHRRIGESEPRAARKCNKLWPLPAAFGELALRRYLLTEDRGNRCASARSCRAAHVSRRNVSTPIGRCPPIVLCDIKAQLEAIFRGLHVFLTGVGMA